MAVGLLGRKVGMTQVFTEDGTLVQVTVIEAGPCTVLQVRTAERDGYTAVQVGYGEKPRRLAVRSERGHVAQLSSKRAKQRSENKVEPLPKANCEPPRFVREFRTTASDAAVEVGQKLTLNLLEKVTHVDIIGWNKGRGFAGVMKQWNFHGLRASHGTQRHHRAGGSIASHATNRGFCGRIKKGKKMSGRWGNEQITVRNLRVVRIDEASNIILVNGSVPGPNGGYVLLRQTKKLKSKAAQ